MKIRNVRWAHAGRGLMVAVFALACVAAAPAFAGPYAALSPNLGNLGYDDLSTSVGGRAELGYVLPSVPLFFELSWLDTGKAEVELPAATVGPPAEVRFRGGLAGIGYALEWPSTPMWFWARAGYYFGESETSGAISSTHDTSGAALALGVSYRLTPWMAVRAQAESLLRVEDFNGRDRRNLNSVALGIELRGPAAASRRDSGSVCAAGPARAGVNVGLRGRPVDGTPVIAALEPGQALRVYQGLGTWCFVGVNGEPGWVRDAELVRGTGVEP